MGHLSIRCISCGNKWDVHHRDDWKDWKARTCPVCQKEINKAIWEQAVLPAFNEAEEMSMEMFKYKEPFVIGYVMDVPKPVPAYDDYLKFMCE